MLAWYSDDVLEFALPSYMYTYMYMYMYMHHSHKEGIDSFDGLVWRLTEHKSQSLRTTNHVYLKHSVIYVCTITLHLRQ